MDKEILKHYTLYKHNDISVFIKNEHFSFSYTSADSVCRHDLIGKYRYFGGLQCNYHNESQEYKELESVLCDIAEIILNI
jgi:hypothetical protein